MYAMVNCIASVCSHFDGAVWLPKFYGEFFYDVNPLFKFHSYMQAVNYEQRLMSTGFFSNKIDDHGIIDRL